MSEQIAYLECIIIPQEISRLKHKQKIKQHWINNHHGHIFGYNRKCKCELLQKDYLFNQNKEQKVCEFYAPVNIPK